MVYIQLWKEEKACLLEQIKKVPYGGTIVEIGTVDGLTAFLLAKSTSEKMLKFAQLICHHRKQLTRSSIVQT